MGSPSQDLSLETLPTCKLRDNCSSHLICCSSPGSLSCTAYFLMLKKKLSVSSLFCFFLIWLRQLGKFSPTLSWPETKITFYCFILNTLNVFLSILWVSSYFIALVLWIRTPFFFPTRLLDLLLLAYKKTINFHVLPFYLDNLPN